MQSLGDFKTTETIYAPFDTYASAGESVTISGLAVTDIEIYKDGSVTQRASDNGYTLLDTDGIDFDGSTGLHGFSVALTDNSDAGFYANGSQYWLHVNAITVDGKTVKFTYYFTIGKTHNADVTKWNGTTVATPDTAGYPKTTIKSGTGTGELNLSSGVVRANNANGEPLKGIKSVFVITSAGAFAWYSSPELAETALASGDRAYVSGFFLVTGSFGKSGVRYAFDLGAGYVKTASGDIWTCTAGSSYTVTGHGVFRAAAGSCVSLNSPTMVVIEAFSLLSEGAGNPAVKVLTGTTTATRGFHIKLAGQIQSFYDNVWIDGDYNDADPDLQPVCRFSVEAATWRTSNDHLELGLDATPSRVRVFGTIKGQFNNVGGGRLVNAQLSTGEVTTISTGMMAYTGDYDDNTLLDGADTILNAEVDDFKLKIICPYIKARLKLRSNALVHIVGATIDTSEYTGAGGDTGDGSIWTFGSALTLEDVTLITSSASVNSIDGLPGVSVNILGSLTTTKPLSANVTPVHTANKVNIVNVADQNAIVSNLGDVDFADLELISNQLGSISGTLTTVTNNTNQIMEKTDFLPSVTAGATGGLLVAGSNAATTFATLTSTGVFSINGVSNVAQTGDSFTRLGAPAGASVSADIAAIPASVSGGLTVDQAATLQKIFNLVQ